MTRDPDSTYTGAIETAAEFGKRLYLEAWNRGCTYAWQSGARVLRIQAMQDAATAAVGLLLN